LVFKTKKAAREEDYLSNLNWVMLGKGAARENETHWGGTAPPSSDPKTSAGRKKAGKGVGGGRGLASLQFY